MRYTEPEEKELNRQLKKWHNRQLTAIRKNNIDEVFNKMPELDKAIWGKIANAESYKEVNWIVWQQAEQVITKYCKLAH